MSDTDRLLGSFGIAKSPLNVLLSNFNNNRLLNIRRFYTDRKSNELLPSSKGISLKEDELDFLRDTLTKHHIEIEDHFVSELSEDEKRTRIKQKSKFAGLKVKTSQGQIELSIGQVGGSELFKIEHLAGKVTLTLNQDYEYFNCLRNEQIPNDVIQLIGVILVAIRFDPEQDSLQSSYLHGVRQEIKLNIK